MNEGKGKVHILIHQEKKKKKNIETDRRPRKTQVGIIKQGGREKKKA